MIDRIFTDRYYQDWPSWHIVYEWEDELAKGLHIPINNSPSFPKTGLSARISNYGKRYLNSDLTEYLCKGNKIFSYFEMWPKFLKNFSNSKNAIPILIDFWDRKKLKEFEKIYGRCRYVLVSSIEVINFMKENGCNLNLIHFPLSLPDKYKLNIDQQFDKKYDIVLAGRTNPVLWDYLQKYEQTHPQIEYLTQTEKDGELYYQSNQKGILKKVHDRAAYIELIRSAKISFYSTPGIDGGESRTQGFNPVTPRIFELLSAGCHIIARYPQNAETDFFKLDQICPSVNNYEEFERQLNFALNAKELPIERNANFLIPHYTSNRINIIKQLA